jgi:AcrR family transcriptional regulator
VPVAQRADGGTTAAERGAQTRERLLEATVRLLVSVGWAGVTTRAVAEEAGVNPALVHYHFRGVDELRREAVRRALNVLVSASMTKLEAAPDPATGAREALEEVLRAERRDPTLSVLLLEAAEGSIRDEVLREEFAALLKDLRAQLTGWIAEQTGSGDAPAVAALVLAALDGIYLHHLLDPDLDVAAFTAPLLRLLGVDEKEAAAAGEEEA